MKKKLVSVLLCAAMVGTMLAGCGGGDDSSDSGTAGDTKQEDAGDSSTADAGDSESGTLVYWAMWDAAEPQAKVIQAAIDKYTEDTGVKVDVQFKGRTGQREGLEPALAAGQTIDMFDEDVNRVNGTWGKYLMDLEEIAKDYEANNANATLLEIARNASEDGKLKSIPYQPSLFGFFYNKDLFDQAGITEAPQTWEDFDAACKKLKDAGITPITGDDAYMTCWTGYHLGRYVGQDRVKEIVTNGEWDDPAVMKMAEDLADFASKGYFSENIGSNVFPAGQNTEFAVGEAAIILDGSWLPNEVKDTAGEDFNYGYFNYPTLEGGTDDNTANNIANQVLAINKDSKMSKEAFELITYITTGEFDKQMTEEALCIPTDKNNTEWPAQLEAVKPGFDATKTYYNWAVDVESNNDATPAIKDSTNQLLAGSLDAQGFVDALKSAS